MGLQLLSSHLSNNDARSTLTSKFQIRVNDVVRAILGLGRTNSPAVADLLGQTGLPSVNRLAVGSVAKEA